MRYLIAVYIVIFNLAGSSLVLSENIKPQPVFQLTFEEGMVTRVVDNFPDFFGANDSPFGSTTFFQSLKKSIIESYSAIFANDRDKILEYFDGGVPRVLQVPNKSNGSLEIFLITKKENEIRMMLKLEFQVSDNEVIAIYDAHSWNNENERGWSVSSLMYE